MAIPQDQFDKLVDAVTEKLMGEIRKELDSRPAPTVSSQPSILDLNELQEQLIESVRRELRIFKQGLLTDIAAQQVLPPAFSPPTPTEKTPQKSTSWLDKKLF